MSCADACVTHDYDSGGNTALYREGFSRARNAYTCCECGVSIAIGERYQWASGKTEGGGMFREHTCEVCAEIRAAFVCGSWVFGALWESLRDELFPRWKTHSAIDCLAKLQTADAVAMSNNEFAEWNGEEDGVV
jgi:hypothetical protein